MRNFGTWDGDSGLESQISGLGIQICRDGYEEQRRSLYKVPKESLYKVPNGSLYKTNWSELYRPLIITGNLLTPLSQTPRDCPRGMCPVHYRPLCKAEKKDSYLEISALSAITADISWLHYHYDAPIQPLFSYRRHGRPRRRKRYAPT